MDEFIDQGFNYVITPIITFLKGIIDFLFATKLSTLIFGFLFMNLIGFLLMRIDKKIAVDNGKTDDENKKRRRVSESTLFLVAIVYGSLGILLGMYKFKHKTLKNKFKYGIPIIIVLQIIFTIWAIVSKNIAIN